MLNHVLLHQTIVGLEVKDQLKVAGEKYPDIMIGCVGGGSNFAGFAFPFIKDKLTGKHDIRFIAVEPTACPKMTKGEYRYDFGDTAELTPLVLMHTLGHNFVPPGIHAGGLRYHGNAPLLSQVVKEKIVEPRALTQRACFEAGILFAKTEGILPAPESTHAIKAAIDEARAAHGEKVIVFNLSGHGHFDLSAYEAYLSGEMRDYDLPTEEIKKALERVPKV